MFSHFGRIIIVDFFLVVVALGKSDTLTINQVDGWN